MYSKVVLDFRFGHWNDLFLTLGSGTPSLCPRPPQNFGFLNHLGRYTLLNRSCHCLNSGLQNVHYVGFGGIIIDLIDGQISELNF